MACVNKEANGRWKVQFMPVEKGRKRQALRLGPVTKREAEEIKNHVERILESRRAGLALEERSEQWLAKLPDHLRRRLVATGVIEDGGQRARSTLSGFIDDYLSARTDLTAGTHSNLRSARSFLERYFGATREMASITKGEAIPFRAWLEEEGLAESYIRGICRKARQFFRSALDHRVIRENPFAGMKKLTDLASPKRRQFYVSRALADQVLVNCPSDEWRLIFALARYGGLRCPSELVTLKWSDIDWKKGQFIVFDTKRKRHDGRETREVPLFPELRPYLEACCRAKDRHPEKVIKRVRCTKNNLRTQMIRILKKAEIKVWPKLFQNLRSSRESELIKVHGVEVACQWIGNTPAVAMKHYLQITDEDYEKALEAWRTLGRQAS
jgi:integrase